MSTTFNDWIMQSEDYEAQEEEEWRSHFLSKGSSGVDHGRGSRPRADPR
jgi:hypothetical protein